MLGAWAETWIGGGVAAFDMDDTLEDPGIQSCLFSSRSDTLLLSDSQLDCPSPDAIRSPAASWWHQQQPRWTETPLPSEGKRPARYALSPGTPTPVKRCDKKMSLPGSSKALHYPGVHPEESRYPGKGDVALLGRVGPFSTAANGSPASGGRHSNSSVVPSCSSPSARRSPQFRCSTRHKRSQSMETLSSPQPTQIRRALREALEDAASASLPNMKSPTLRVDRSMPSSSVWLPMSARAGRSPSRCGTPGSANSSRFAGNRGTRAPASSSSSKPTAPRLQRSPHASPSSPWGRSPTPSASGASPLRAVAMRASPTTARRGPQVADTGGPPHPRVDQSGLQMRSGDNVARTTATSSTTSPYSSRFGRAKSARMPRTSSLCGTSSTAAMAPVAFSRDNVSRDSEDQAAPEDSLQWSTSVSPLRKRVPSAPSLGSSSGRAAPTIMKEVAPAKPPYPSPGDFQSALERAPGLSSGLRKDLLEVLGEIRLGPPAPLPLSPRRRSSSDFPSSDVDGSTSPCPSSSSTFSSRRSIGITGFRGLDAGSLGDGLFGAIHVADAIAAPGSPTMSDMEAALDSMPSPRHSNFQPPLDGSPSLSTVTCCTSVHPPTLPELAFSSTQQPVAFGGVVTQPFHLPQTSSAMKENVPSTLADSPARSFSGTAAACRITAMAAARDRYKVTIGATARSGEFRTSVLRELDALRSSPSPQDCRPKSTVAEALSIDGYTTPRSHIVTPTGQTAATDRMWRD